LKKELQHLKSDPQQTGREDMAHLGNIDIFGPESNLNSGLALLLAQPTNKSHTLRHRDAVIQLESHEPIVTVSFDGASSHEEAHQNGASLVQEGLDILSITGEGDFATRDVRDEYFVWWKDGTVQTVAAVNTLTLTFSVPKLKFEIRDKDGNLVMSDPVDPDYNIAFRFFRLSQVSDDLFDAFRNMYLAFEVLLSTKHPPNRGEREIDWLNRALRLSETELRLAQLIKTENTNRVQIIIETVYKNARLPLFHAKDGRAYFAPSVDGEGRSTVSEALKMLTSVVIRMAEVWSNVRRPGGGVFHSWVYRQIRESIPPVTFVASEEKNVDRNETDPTKLIGARFPGTISDRFFDQQRVYASGSLDLSSATLNRAIQAVSMVNDKTPLCFHVFETPLGIGSVDRLDVVTFFRVANASLPRERFNR
jgi:hypothetical protein